MICQMYNFCLWTEVVGPIKKRMVDRADPIRNMLRRMWKRKIIVRTYPKTINSDLTAIN